MAGVSVVRRRLDDERVRRVRRTVVAVCFGDGVGLTLFLASLAVFVATWRAGAFINDVSVFVVLLERVADGHLSVGRVGQIETVNPGMYHVGADVYGRNYGQVVASLPAYWLVEGVGPGPFRWLVVVAWSGLVAAVGVRAGSHLNRRRLGATVGVTAAAVALLANALTFDPFRDGAAVIALQVTSMLVAAMTPVLLYRLVARQSGRTMGVLAGGTAAFATPVGFWATVPKRHAFTATLVVVALYALARSREERGPESSGSTARLGQAGFRAVAYASAGLLAWVHAPEGFTLFLALAVVDLPTAPSNDRRTLTVIGAAFALSLAPFFLTNYLISGNPVEPPRFLSTYRGPGSVPDSLLPGAGGDAAGGGGGGGGGSRTSDGTTAGTGALGGLSLDAFLPTVLVALLRRGFFQYVDGVALAVSNPERLVTVFVRWGRHGYDPAGIFFGDGTNLSVLESAPLAVAVAVAPLRYAVRAVRSRDVTLPEFTPTDAFALAFSLLLVALYLPRLPTRVMVTVRYLHPLYPLVVYAVFRQRWLVDALQSHTRVALWGYEAAVLLGTPLAVATLLFTSLSKGAVVQGLGLAALAAAGLLAAAGVVEATGYRPGLSERASVLSAGLAAGAGTVFLLLTAFVLMHYGPSALPFVEAVTGDVRFAILRHG